MKTVTSHSLNDTHAIAKEWLFGLMPGQLGASAAKVVGLSGPLGSGKTAFVQEVARSLGIDGPVTSPTFVIMKAYPVGSVALGSDYVFGRLIHIDAYRLERAEELEALNFEQWVEEPGNLILIEWPENVEKALPDGTPIIRFENMGEGIRRIVFP
jgi:tRNA threonylcarbamoyladenosine biosynthesis protein TsaE